jgi:hypothetical protein
VCGAAGDSMGADKSTSGAGLGIKGRPSLDANDDEKSPEDGLGPLEDGPPISGGKSP